jgi:hypothetical protein
MVAEECIVQNLIMADADAISARVQLSGDPGRSSLVLA